MSPAAALQTCMVGFLDRVSARLLAAPVGGAGGEVEGMLADLAAGLGHLLAGETGAFEVGVAWRDAAGPRSAALELAAYDLDVPPADQADDGQLRVAWYRGEDGALACVRVEPAGAGLSPSALWIMRPPAAASTDEWERFGRDVGALRQVFVTVCAVLQARTAVALAASARRADLGARVAGLVDRRTKWLPEHLRDASELARALLAEPAQLDLLANVATSVLQELLGTGWTVRRLRPREPHPDAPGGAAAAGAPLRALTELLRTVVSRAAPTTPPPGQNRHRRQIAAVSRCFDALLDNFAGSEPEGERPPPPAGEEALALLPVWTRLHEEYRARAGRPTPGAGGGDGDADADWRGAAALTQRQLVGFLDVDQTAARVRRPGERRSARNWMTLWFATQLLHAEATLALSSPERTQLRADLAYVLREGLRFACFGGRPDYRYHASAYVAALTGLVASHAAGVARVPHGYGIASFLGDVARGGGADRYAAAEHLQHLLEVYVAGHFLLELRLVGPPGAPPPVAGGWTVGQALLPLRGGTQPPLALVEPLRCALALAMLFHDAGHLLFPSDLRQQAAPELPVPLRKPFAALPACVKRAGVDLTAHCLRDLGISATAGQPGAGPRPGYFDAAEAEQLASWFDGEAERGAPNHALLGAWYLHHRRPAAAAGDVLAGHTMAVRAVLMHDAVRARIDANRDPIAGLLVLCNEVFEWDRARHGGPGREARSLHVMAAAIPPREPRDRRIRIPNLRVRPGEPGCPPQAVLALDESEAKAWPRIELLLQPPHLLDGPVYQVWLAKAQSLGRVSAHGLGFSPILVVEAAVDPGYGGFDSRTLLERAIAVEPTAELEALRGWLRPEARFHTETRATGRFERASLGGLDEPLCERDVQELFAGLAERAEQAIDDARG